MKHGKRVKWSKPVLEIPKENPQKGLNPGIQFFEREDKTLTVGIRTPISKQNIAAGAVLYEPTVKIGLKTQLQYIIFAEQRNRGITHEEALKWMDTELEGWREQLKNINWEVKDK